MNIILIPMTYTYDTFIFKEYNKKSLDRYGISKDSGSTAFT